MNVDRKPYRLDIASRASSDPFRGDVARRDGSMRAVTLEKRLIKTDQISGATGDFQKPIQDTFVPTAYETTLEELAS